MKEVLFLAVLLSVVSSVTSLSLYQPYRVHVASNYTWKTVYFNQQLDHFNFARVTQKFRQRLLINTDNYKRGGPLFFYTGNEGDIELFAENTGFVFDIAPQFNAAVVFAEHRYYGQSLPFGNESFADWTKSRYLSVEQALADYVENIKWLKEEYLKVKDTRTVTFGGSYGGMLAAWMRMSYPAMVQGAIAASAPVWMFPGMQKDCTGPYQIITRVFTSNSHDCSKKVAKSWDLIKETAKTGEGRSMLEKMFKLCKPLKKGEENKLSGWLEGMYFDMAMVNYPYPTSFLSPLPAWPVKNFCNSVSQVSDVLSAIAAGSQVYFNHTGQALCLDIDSDPAGGLGMLAWEYQACMELILPICSDPDKDMFPKENWNLKEYVMECEKKWNTTAKPYTLKYRLGGEDGYDYYDYSQIFFSNGNLDPWAAGGVAQIPSEDVCRFDCPNVIIDQGAHHLDLRASNPADPESVLRVRDQEIEAIRRWTRRDINRSLLNEETVMF